MHPQRLYDEDTLTPDAWYWVTDGDAIWVAKWDGTNWTNDDTWFDFDETVINCKEIHSPPKSWAEKAKRKADRKEVDLEGEICKEVARIKRQADPIKY